MDIESIFPPYIYAVRYDQEGSNEFDRLMNLWNDALYLSDFLDENKKFLKDPVWKHIVIPEMAARQVMDEAQRLEELFVKLKTNTDKGRIPDFDTHFKYLDGKYKYLLEYIPMKSYGPNTPSLLRLYAIKVQANTIRIQIKLWHLMLKS